jgi:ribonuclease HII
VRATTFLRAAELRLVADVSGLLAGVDEVGRGTLAGPVVAAAVILDDRRRIRGLDDSKRLSPGQRERLDGEIRRKAVCFSIAEASVEEIDRLNILRASLLAMRRAVEGLHERPAIVLVDGNQRPDLDLPVRMVVGGDAKVRAIAAASIVAKVYRDRLLTELHQEHPRYGFDGHKGYATADHLAALREHGACRHHRRSFAPVREVLDRLF